MSHVGRVLLVMLGGAVASGLALSAEQDALALAWISAPLTLDAQQ